MYSVLHIFFFFKQKTAYEMRISDWSSDVCSSDLFYPGLSVAALGYVIRDKLHVLLGQGIIEPAADQALYSKDSVIGIGDGLTLGRLTDQAFAILGKSHDRWRCACPFRIFDDLRFATIHDCDTAVRRAKVDTNNFAHIVLF